MSVSDTAKIPKLEIVEQLRVNHHIKGQLNDFRIDEEEISISFQGPGYTADFFVNRADGKYELTETNMGIIAVINDLHKGRDAPGGWKLFLDLSALFLALVSLTGLLLGVLLPKSRRAALLVLGLGGLLFLALALYAAR